MKHADQRKATYRCERRDGKSVRVRDIKFTFTTNSPLSTPEIVVLLKQKWAI